MDPADIFAAGVIREANDIRILREEYEKKLREAGVSSASQAELNKLRIERDAAVKAAKKQAEEAVKKANKEAEEAVKKANKEAAAAKKEAEKARQEAEKALEKARQDAETAKTSAISAVDKKAEEAIAAANEKAEKAKKEAVAAKEEAEKARQGAASAKEEAAAAKKEAAEATKKAEEAEKAKTAAVAAAEKEAEKANEALEAKKEAETAKQTADTKTQKLLSKFKTIREKNNLALDKSANLAQSSMRDYETVLLGIYKLCSTGEYGVVENLQNLGEDTTSAVNTKIDNLENTVADANTEIRELKAKLEVPPAPQAPPIPTEDAIAYERAINHISVTPGLPEQDWNNQLRKNFNYTYDQIIKFLSKRGPPTPAKSTKIQTPRKLKKDIESDVIIVSKVMNNDAGIIIKSRLDKLNAYTSNIYTGTEPVKFFSEMFKQDDVNGRTREILDKKKELLTILRKQFFFNYLKDVNGFNVNNSFDEAVKTIMRHIMIYNDEETRLNYKFGFYICAYWLFLNMREIMTPNHNRAIKNTNLLIVLERIISNFAKYIDNTREYQNFLDEMGTEKMKEQKSLWSIGEGKTINVKASKITDFTTPSPSSKTPSPSTKSHQTQ